MLGVGRVAGVRGLATMFQGKLLAAEILAEVKQGVAALGSKPSLVAIAVGNHPASKIYLTRKAEAAEVCGVEYQQLAFPPTITEKELIEVIEGLNTDSSVHGVIVQLPLPPHMSESRICNSVLPDKDVDGFTGASLGRLVQGENGLVPCTALAVREIVKRATSFSSGSDQEPSWRGKRAVVVGRSHNVGLPIQILLGSDGDKGGLDMTVTLCHRYTPPEDLAKAVQASDLVVSAAGVPGIITREIVKPGAVLVDVGLTRVCHLGKNLVVGDVHKEARQVASLVTPVPGGVGPCTVACLMSNTLRAAEAFLS